MGTDSPTPPAPIAPDEERLAFERLKPRLRALWAEVFPRDDEPYTSVVVPSVTLAPGDLARRPWARHFEETLLFMLIRLRNPKARVVYLTSAPIPPLVMDYYLQFLAGIPASHAARRLTLLSAHDTSPRPLTEKILERPRLVERIRGAIPDPARAYLTVFRSTPLERRLAVRLGIPLNAADPETEALCTKSAGRRLLREAGVEVPLGYEDLRSEAEVLDALEGLRRRRPGLRRAVLKLDTSQWDEGHALVRLPADGSREALAAALRALTLSVRTETPASYLERFACGGGVVQEFLEPPDLRTASVQLRVSPLGEVSVSSTHDEERGGPAGLSTQGCLFPADATYRLRLHDAGRRVAEALARRGVVSRLSVEFLVWREDARGPWRLTGSEVNLGVGGSTHPLLAVRFLCGGALDAQTGAFRSPSGRPKCYRATDTLESPAYRGLLPEDLVELATLSRLNYSPQTEAGALFYMFGALSELGRVGMVAIADTREEAAAVFDRAVAALDRACARSELPGG